MPVVSEVFTPDGTYSAFGATYALADFPALVEAAPKGLFMTGTPAPRARRRRRPTGRADRCCSSTRPNHAHADGLVHRHLRAHRRRLAAQDPVDDVPAPQRRRRRRQGPRPAAARADGRATGWTGSRHGARRLPQGDSTTGSTSTPTSSRPTYDGRGHARRADGPDRQGAAARLRRRVGPLGLAGARSGASAVRPLLRAYLSEAVTGARPGRAGPVLDARGARPVGDHLRAAGALRRDGAAAAAGRRGLVPGVLRARAPAATWRRSTCRAVRADDGWRVTGQKVWTSLSQYAQRCVLLTRTGTVESAHRGITALFVDMDTPGHHRPAHRDHGRRAGVLGGLLRRRARAVRPDARRRGPGLGVRHGPAPLRAEHRPLAAGGVAAPPAAATCVDAAAARARSTRPRSARSPSSSTPSGPAPGPPSTAWPPARQLGRGDVDRQGAAGHGRAGRVRPRRRRRCPPRSRSATTR